MLGVSAAPLPRGREAFVDPISHGGLVYWGAMLIPSVTSRVALLSAASALSALALVVACSSDGGTSEAPVGADTGASDDALVVADSADAGSDSAPSGKCADTFGSALTEGFGRIDGVVHAVQKPSDTDCAMPDKDHVVLQVLMDGSVYRMVVNLVSDRGGADTKIRVATFPHALPAPGYEEGWHTGIPLDYANILGAHSADGGFAPLTLDEALAKIVAEVKVGDPVAVYAVSGVGHPEGAELVYRSTPGKNEDGAIVVGPTSAVPTFLLFHFADQTF